MKDDMPNWNNFVETVLDGTYIGDRQRKEDKENNEDMDSKVDIYTELNI